MLDRPAGSTDATPTARRDRSAQRLALEQSEASALNGAAVLAILRRRKWLLLASILLCPLLTVLAISQMTPRYTATGTILYDPSDYKLQELQSILPIDPITDSVMATQAEVLHSMPVAMQVARELHLYANPEFNASLQPKSLVHRALGELDRFWSVPTEPTAVDLPGPKLEPAVDATLDAVRAALAVIPVKSSHVLEVSFTATNPVIAAAAVNNAMDYYVKSQLGRKYGAINRARDLLEQRRNELHDQVRRQEDAIAKYRADHGLVEGMHARLDNEQVSLLTETLARAQSSLAEAEGKLDAATGRAGATAQATIAPSVVQLRARHDQLSADLQSMLGRLGPKHPEVLAARAQLAEVDRATTTEIAHVVAAIEADVRVYRQQIDGLERDLSEQQDQIARGAVAQVPLNEMLRNADASRGLLQAVLQRIQQTAQQPILEAPDAHEISLALVPGRPSFPRTGAWMAAASSLGILLGLLLVYVRELADATFHSGDDVRTVLGMPCLALIPRMRRRALKGVEIEDYAARKPHSALAEQLRSLRAGLSLAPDRPRIVAVTAAREKEGKTTVTRALGRLAAMNGERVVALDCDLRHPWSVQSEVGLVDYLQGRASLNQVIRRDTATGLTQISSGTSEANALGLLMSANMARLLQTLRDQYNLVLLDTPPAEAITDARIVAGLADATVLCVRWRATSRHVALHALELLEEAHANVVGTVLTQVDVNVHVRSGYADADVYHPRYGGYFRE